MRELRFRSILLLLASLWSLTVSAQTGNRHKAERHLQRARMFQLEDRRLQAEKQLLKALRAAPAYPPAYVTLIDFYKQQQQYEKAAGLFDEATARCRSCADVIALPLAELLLRDRQYDLALQVLGQWQPPAKSAVSLQRRYDRLLQNIRFAQSASDVTPVISVVNMGARINSGFDEYFPSVSQDDSTLVFTRKTNGIDEDFYLAERDSCGGWFPAAALGEPPNSSDHEGAQMISADDHYLFFMRCGNRSLNGRLMGGCDLYFSYTDQGRWSQPIPFRGAINTPAFEGMPTLASDNRTLYFVSDRPGGYGGKDIWKSEFIDGLWQIPENLGPTINTAYDETAPWIAIDDQTLYFTSNGHPGFGGNDLFIAKKDAAGKWLAPENLGHPYNSPYEDVSLTLSKDGQKVYFASDRPGGIGGMDLYEAPLNDKLQPQPRNFVYGIVKDSLTGLRLNYALMQWSDATTGNVLATYQSNHGDASYMIALPIDTPIVVHTVRPGYLERTDTLRFTQQHVYPADTFHLALLPGNYQPPLTDTLLFRLHFEKNDVSLADSLQEQIRRCVAAFRELPYASFYINSFTDDSGNPELNESLAYERGRLVGTLLYEAGIPESKIHIQGWANAFPLVPNSNDENRRKNRRVEIVLRKAK